MGLHSAKWMQLTNGVEYYYGRFTNLLGTVDGFTASKNDLHLLRIDYANAPVRMKFVDHTQESTKRRTTSWTAAQHNALFAINMTMEYREGTLGYFSPKPQGYAKADGAVIPNGWEFTGTKAGFAFNDDKTYKFDKDWPAVDPETGKAKADAWDNVVTHEAYTIHDGVATWGANATYFSRANYTFFGTTADGVLWAGAVDGRREGVSDGLAYHLPRGRRAPAGARLRRRRVLRRGRIDDDGDPQGPDDILRHLRHAEDVGGFLRLLHDELPVRPDGCRHQHRRGDRARGHQPAPLRPGAGAVQAPARGVQHRLRTRRQKSAERRMAGLAPRFRDAVASIVTGCYFRISFKPAGEVYDISP